MSRNPIERFMMPMRMTSRPWDNADISSATACDFLEVYNNPRSCRKEIRQAGVAANLGQAALDALNEVYNQVAMTHGDTRSVTRQAHENFTRSLATAVNHNLNQLAEDKLWPMFWMAFHHDMPRAPRYERDRSGESVATFKADFGLSNADWKMFCNAGHVYLYNHFDIDFRPGSVNQIPKAAVTKKAPMPPEWKLDQIRGYKNEIPKHKALDAVAEMLLAVIRGDVKLATYQKETK